MATLDAPEACPVCATAYDSVSVHKTGLMVNLLDNKRYRRVCFDPAIRDGTAVVRFYHHTHEQVDTAPDTDGVSHSEKCSDSD
ncbi:MAG: hypothetical protein U5K28_06010 [Halobacteriales archaeon]|nr:hypothetical protein [Halobacteriales archaeon]